MLLAIDGVKQCEVRIRECVTTVDLVVLKMEDYNIILRMNWLSKYHVHVNYYHKTVTIGFKDGMTYTFQEEWISNMPSFISCAKV